MAGRARPLNSEIDSDLSTSPAAKKTKLDDLAAQSNQLPKRTPNELSLESSEILPSSDESFCEEEDKEKTSTTKNSTSTTAGPSSASSSATVSSLVTATKQQQPSKEMGRESSIEHMSLMGDHALYQQLSIIGDGAYGTVYRARDANTGEIVALKKVRVAVTNDGLPPSTLREIAALKQVERFEHPHIVKLLDVCQGNYIQVSSDDGRTERIDRGLTLWLVFEHVEQDLATYLEMCESYPSPPSMVRMMAKEILLGVDFLHSHRIIHRDLKPQNLLVTTDGHIKIADFGLAKTYDFEMRLTTVVVTLWYRSPEILLGCTYASPIDIWSVGCILAELCEQKPLFAGKSEGDQLDKIFRTIGTPPENEWPESISLNWSAFPYSHSISMKAVIPHLSDSGLDLVQSMLTFNPHKRITAAQALQHRYFIEDLS